MSEYRRVKTFSDFPPMKEGEPMPPAGGPLSVIDVDAGIKPRKDYLLNQSGPTHNAYDIFVAVRKIIMDPAFDFTVEADWPLIKMNPEAVKLCHGTFGVATMNQLISLGYVRVQEIFPIEEQAKLFEEIKIT